MNALANKAKEAQSGANDMLQKAQTNNQMLQFQTNPTDVKSGTTDLTDMLKDGLFSGNDSEADSMSAIEEIFEMVGLNKHPQGEQIKVAVMSFMESISVPDNYIPAEQTLGQYLAECTTCKQTQKTFEKECHDVIKKHYEKKRNDYEQDFKLKLQAYLNKNTPDYLRKPATN